MRSKPRNASTPLPAASPGGHPGALRGTRPCCAGLARLLRRGQHHQQFPRNCQVSARLSRRWWCTAQTRSSASVCRLGVRAEDAHRACTSLRGRSSFSRTALHSRFTCRTDSPSQLAASACVIFPSSPAARPLPVCLPRTHQRSLHHLSPSVPRTLLLCQRTLPLCAHIRAGRLDPRVARASNAGGPVLYSRQRSQRESSPGVRGGSRPVRLCRVRPLCVPGPVLLPIGLRGGRYGRHKHRVHVLAGVSLPVRLPVRLLVPYYYNYYPYYYNYYPYYYPWSFSLGLSYGWWGGGHRHGHSHRHGGTAAAGTGAKAVTAAAGG